MTANMKLAAEGCAAIFDPADGGWLTSFRVGDHELLVKHGRDVFHSGSFVIAPWVGRLRDARLRPSQVFARALRGPRSARPRLFLFPV